MQKISLADKLGAFAEHWSPKIIGELNGQYVKLVKFCGDFIWHHHEHEDEMFLVIHGSFRMNYREASGVETSLQIAAGEFIIVPRGTEHRPCAAEEVHVMLFEPAGTLNTGNVQSPLTVTTPASI